MNESRELATLKQSLLIWLILGLTVFGAWLLCAWLIYYVLRRYEVLSPTYATGCATAAAAAAAAVVGGAAYLRARIV